MTIHIEGQSASQFRTQRESSARSAQGEKMTVEEIEDCLQKLVGARGIGEVRAVSRASRRRPCCPGFFCQVLPLLATVPRNPDGPRQDP